MVQMIARFCKMSNLPKATAVRVRAHFDDLFEFSEDCMEDEKLLGFLPPVMATTVVNACYRHWPAELTVLNSLQDSARAKMMKVIVPCVVAPKEWLFKFGDVGTQCFFVYQGQIELSLDTGRVFCVLVNDGVLGEVSIVTSRPRCMGAQSRDRMCYGAFANKADIVEISQDFPSLWAELKREVSPAPGSPPAPCPLPPVPVATPWRLLFVLCPPY